MNGGQSVLGSIEQVLTEIEAQTDSLVGKHILWRGDDRPWDLLLPDASKQPLYVAIYPLGARELSVAKVKLQAVVRAGLIPGIIP
ncbi:MAG: hypothetical protein EOO92_20035 [Pedobacter sp.]|nr:MAG: hypothetical protein EOO92_20035 [Pedobacter sp.]